MTVVSCRRKSSAVSVSTFPGLGRRESAPSRPLGLPVAKKNVAAHRGVARHAVKANAAPIKLPRDFAAFLVVLIPFKEFLNLFIFQSFPLSEFLDYRQRSNCSGPSVRVHGAKGIFHPVHAHSDG